MPKIKVVFFDAGGTLFRPYPSVGHVYAQVADKHGVRVSPDEIEQRFRNAWHVRNGLANLASITDEKIERDWWEGVVREVFAEVAVFRDFPTFFSELYDFFATAECWRLFDDARPTLDELHAAGYRLGIISNWDHRLFSIVEQLGLRRYFEHIFASAAVGVPKPGRGIFQTAISAFGIEPQEGLHIGDSLVLIDRPRKAYNGVVQIQTLRDLKPLLS
jgi:putative hydrolase of the HAD superfamily